MFRSSLASCLSEKHVYRGCQSTDDEPEASEGEASQTGHSRLNLNSHKRHFRHNTSRCNNVSTVRTYPESAYPIISSAGTHRYFRNVNTLMLSAAAQCTRTLHDTGKRRNNKQ